MFAVRSARIVRFNLSISSALCTNTLCTNTPKTVGAAIPLNQTDKTTKTVQSDNNTLFPWRGNPVQSWTLSDFFTNKWINFWCRSVLVKGLIIDEEVAGGAKQAFTVAADSIFNQFDTTTENFYISNSKLSFEAQDARSLYLEKNLAVFYDAAVRDFMRKSEHTKLEYSLESIIDAVVVSKDVISAAKRDTVTNLGGTMPFRRNFLGIGVLIYTDDIPEDSEETAEQQRHNKMVKHLKSDDMKVFTFRYSVDLVCREMFCVRDAQGEVLQGDTEVVTRTHRIVLESAIELVNASIEDVKEAAQGRPNNVTMKFVNDWSIVDIDDWMQGNKFWVEDME